MDTAAKLNASLDQILQAEQQNPPPSQTKPHQPGGRVRRSSQKKPPHHSPYARPAQRKKMDHSLDDDAPRQGVRVFVGNLGYRVSWQSLKDHCAQAGPVLHANVLTYPDGRSKGAGIVEFATAEGASNAIESLRDTELEGRKIFLREDRESKGFGQAGAEGAREGGSGGGPRFQRGPRVDMSKVEPNSKVFVQNLPWSLNWMDLKTTCQQYGEVLRSDVALDHLGRSRGNGTVLFASAAAAAACIAGLNDTEIEGRRVAVRLDQRVGCNLHVGNLPYSATWQDLKTLFSQYGDVIRADVVTEPGSRRSKGFGVVIMGSAANAASAIEGLNETEFRGRNLLVKHDEYA